MSLKIKSYSLHDDVKLIKAKTKTKQNKTKRAGVWGKQYESNTKMFATDRLIV